MALQPPPGAPISPDGRWWWDGAAWQPMPPAGQPPPPTAPPAPGLAPPPYRVASLRALFAVIGLGAVALTVLAGMGVDLYGISIYATVGAGGRTLGQADADYGLTALAWSVVFYLLYIPTIVLFCVWEHRAAANLPALGGRELRFTPGWAVGWWFVPIANLFRPYQVMAELWKASDPALDETYRRQRQGLSTPLLLKLWWAAWIVGNVITNFSNRASFAAHDPTSNIGALVVDLAGSAITVAAAGLAILVVKNADARQVAKAARLGLSPR